MENKITCPHCQKEIDVEEILVHNIEDRFEEAFKLKEKELSGKFSQKEQEFAHKELELQEKNHKINHLIEEKAAKLSLEKEAQIKETARKEMEIEIADYKNQVGENKMALTGLKQELLDLRKANRIAEKEKEDLKLEFEDQKEAYANQKMREVQQKEEVKMGLKIREKELLENPRKLTPFRQIKLTPSRQIKLTP